MASLGNALVTKILGHSAAEKAFRPWWDNLEDFLIYGLVMLGLVVAPTAMINSTPLDCNFCSEDNCNEFFEAQNVSHKNPKDPGFNLWWVKKYCTMSAVDGFVLYFPYILLIMALVIVLIERVFLRIFKAGLKLDTFYNLIRNDTIGCEQSSEEEGNQGFFDNDIENSKIALEVLHSFSDKSNYFVSYLIRTISEGVIAVSLLVWLLLKGLPSIEKDEFIFCDVHGYYYECAGHPQQFYMYVMFSTIAILIVYLLCCAYNLLWLTFPQLGSLSRVMRQYRSELLRKTRKEMISDKELLGNLYWIYYDNRDLKLLLDLLATSSGVSQSIRVMTLFDMDLRTKSEPSNLKVTRSEDDRHVEIEFGDAFSIKNIFCKIKQLNCIYTVEIHPPTSKSCVQALKFCRQGKESRKESKRQEMGDTEMEPLNARRQKVKFEDLRQDTEYAIRVSTLVNGRPIARRIEKI